MIDKAKIGKYVGRGLQHSVYEYGNNEVIKIPHFWMRWTTMLDQKEKELEIVKKYFADNIPETRVAPYQHSYCYIQKKIEGLEPLMLSHIGIHKPDISSFLKKNERLIQEQKLSADLLGGHAYAHALTRHSRDLPILSANMVIDESGASRVVLLDTDLLRTSLFHFYGVREMPFVLATWAFYLLNKFTMKHYKMM